jgi:hypothetical protein
MASDVTTLPLRSALARAPQAVARREASSREARIGASVLVVIVLGVALLVLAAADRPSFLSAPSHYGFFPRWMAGPFGGLWPWLTRSPQAIKSLMTGALVVMYVAYVVGLRYVPALRARWTVAAIVAVHVLLLLCPPLSLTDVFNYINYGRMGALHGLNPYTTIPALEPHSDPGYYLSNWHGLLSPYGPLFTLITYAVVPLGMAASLWTLKALLGVASLATLLLVWRCARLLGRDPVAAVVFVGLNPIVLVWGLGGDHNDFLTVFCVVLAFYLLLRAGAPGISPELEAAAPATPAGAAAAASGRASGMGRLRGWLWPLAPLELGAGVAIAAAIAMKASAGIVVPVVLAALLSAPRRLVQVVVGMAAGGLVLGACAVAAFGVRLPDLGTQGSLVVPMSLPNVMGLALGQGGETATMHTLLMAALLAAVVGCSVWAWRRGDALSGSGWATVALLVTLSWVLPWYVLWVLPLAALARSRALRAAALAVGAYLILTWMPLATAMDNTLGIRPTTTPLGQAHQQEVHRLLH